MRSFKFDLAKRHVLYKRLLLGNCGVVVGFQLLDLVLNLAQAALRNLQLCHAVSQICLRLTKKLSFRLHSLRHEVVLVHCTDPEAEGFTGNRSLLDSSRIKVFALHVRCDGLDDLVWDVVLVKVEEPIQEALGIGQDVLLTRFPVVIDLFSRSVGIWFFHWFELEHDANSFTGQANSPWRICQYFHLSNVISFELPQALHCNVQSRQGFIQVTLCVILDSLGLCSLLFGLSFFLCHFRRDLLGSSLIHFDDLHHFGDLNLGPLQNWLLLHEHRLETTDLLFRIANLLKANLVALLLNSHLLSLHCQDSHETRQELQIRGRSDVNLPLLNLQEPL
mmetsp:Transcript_24078/g.43597  ORF Transcript_24078/g.43597 Transcript_24078/m.43597 type:complete len:334 (-) Transcript_24078:585-1586(-)